MFMAKLPATLIFGLLGVFVLSGAALAEPFAPLAKDPGKATIEGEEAGYPLQALMLQMTANNMPDKSAVKQPPYPGAVAVRAQPPSEVSSDGETYSTLSNVLLLTTDEVPKVLEFYRKALPDWTNFNFFGFDYLHEGSGEFHPMKKSGIVTPHVWFADITGDSTWHAMPNARTEISIFYK